MTRSTQELIDAAEAHLDASAMSRFSTANGIELLTALKREHATVAALRKALEPFAAFAPEYGGPPDEFAITQGSSLARKQLTMGDCRRARAALALRDPAGKET